MLTFCKFRKYTFITFLEVVSATTERTDIGHVRKENPNVKRVVGHSLGGSVALELQKNYKGLESRTYGAPVWDPFGEDKRIYGKVDRFRNLVDPFSFFDGSANNSIKWDPFTSWSFTHAFDNIAE